ncbi:hypothetical protein NX059_006483 [Plenodomus lindquistii]|nr:hypothetical protein NX059_006483 [Plenodomus lindquistii]
MSAPINIAIAAITSKIALKIAYKLLENPNVSLRGSCRDTSKAPADLRDHKRVQLITADAYNKENLRTLVRGCSTVICCYLADNETMTSGQKLLIDICEEEGVHRYIASDYTVDYRTMDYGDLPPKDPMKDIMAYLKTKQRIVGVHVLIGCIMETFWVFFSGWDEQTNTFKYWGSGDEKWEVSTCQTAAEYVAAVALDENATGVVKFLGDRISIKEVADEMERVYGTRPNLVNLGPLAKGGDESPLEAVRKNVSYLFLTGKATLGNDLDNGKYPQVKPERVVDYLKARDISQLCDRRYGV